MSKYTGRLWLTILILLLSISSAGTISGFAQEENIVPNVHYTFGEYIDFQGLLPQDMQVERVVIFIKAAGETQTRTAEPNVTDEGEFEMRYDLRDQPIRAYSKITYWLEVTTADGDVVEFDKQSFEYEDDRFEWKTRESSQVRVHWYEGDTTFAQSVLDTADLGIQNIQGLLPIELEGIVDIYVYASAKEMRDTLQMSSTNWVGAHTDPDLGVMVVSLPPGPEQRLEMERQIPHELMHIMLYHNLGPAYDNLPTWLNEGLGSVAELYPNPDYLILLNSAYEKGTLLPIASLCETFPQDASGAFLAYAEATSFTRYLHQEYGTTGLEDLVTQYSKNVSCDRGAQMALGSSLTKLERGWRSTAFGENVTVTTLGKLLPWIVLMIVILAIPGALIFKGARGG
jgi:hypothetical protein